MSSDNTNEIVDKIKDILSAYVVIPKFQRVQNELSKYLGRKLSQLEREYITIEMRHHASYLAEAYLEDSPILPNEIMILMAFSDDYSVGKICESVNREYALKHKYNFFCEILPYKNILEQIYPKMHCTWYKVSLILRYLNCQLNNASDNSSNGMLNNLNLKYLLWIDADAVVINHNILVQDIIQKGMNKELIIAEDMTKGCLINAGVLLIKISEWSRNLWEDVWSAEVSSHYNSVYFYEQSALLRCLRVRREGLDIVEPFHSYCGGPKIKLFPHVAVLTHLELNSNRGWNPKTLKLMQDYDNNNNYHNINNDSGDDSNIFAGTKSFDASLPKLSQGDYQPILSTEAIAVTVTVNELENNHQPVLATGVTDTNMNQSNGNPISKQNDSTGQTECAEFIFHAVGQWNKLKVLRDMILQKSIPISNPASLHEVHSFHLFRGKCGAPPTDAAVAAKAKVLSEKINKSANMTELTKKELG